MTGDPVVSEVAWHTNAEVRNLVECHLPAVVGLALRETVRTPAEQEALLALARLVANPMWPADEEAVASWRFSPCEECGRSVSCGASICPRCMAELSTP